MASLASIIQGEASSYEGQVAVANVIQNRAAINYNGYGTSLLAQATAPGQFVGSATPSLQAMNIAAAAQSGQLQDTTGGAFNYVSAVPGSSYGGVAGATGPATAGIIGGGVNIGGNYFSDRWGAPSSGYLASMSGNLTAQDAANDYNQDYNAQGQMVGFGSGSGGTAVASTEPGFSNPDQAYALPGALGDTTGVGAGTATMATNTPDLSAIIGGETPQQSAAIGPSIPDVQGATSQASPSGSGGIPISITDLSGLPGSVTQASTGLSKSVGSAATGVDKALGQATSTLSSAFTNLTGDWLQSIGNLFARGGLVLAGLVLLAGAFLWYTMDRPQATQVIKEIA